MNAVTARNKAPESLEAWANKRPSWVRAAIAIHLAHGPALSDEQIEDLANHCIAESAGELAVPEPDVAPGVLGGAIAAVDIRIDRISSIRGANALSPHAALDFTKDDLSIVYGGNGTGKSGFSRLVKVICGARQAQPIHGNVFLPDRVPLSAHVTLTSPKSGSKTIEWQAPAPAVLQEGVVQVFDSWTAAQLGTSPNAASYLPRAMRLVGALIDTAGLVTSEIKQRRTALASKLPACPDDFKGTAAHAFLSQLAVALTPEAIDLACDLTEDEEAERVKLETDLAQTDPATLHATAIQSLRNAEALGLQVAELANRFNDEALRQLTDARAHAVEARAASDNFARAKLAGIPLPGAGNALWRALWDAAEQYAQVAYPDHGHVRLDQAPLCVLCQQKVELDAQKRFERFAEIVDSALATDAASAEMAVSDLVASLPANPSEAYWTAIGSHSALAPDALTTLSDQVRQRLAAMVAGNTPVPAVDWTPLTTALADRVTKLTKERDDLKALVDPEGRATRLTRLKELQAKQWLGGVKASVLNEVERLKICALLTKAEKLAGTAQLTMKSDEIGERQLATGYKERFNKELCRLGGGALPVKLSHRKEGKGRFVFFIELADAQTPAKQWEILSEGEQRIVALAAFLADVEGRPGATPVIFDDPISSLDQRFEEAVTKRLVELASHRQVIVFTHRLSMCVLLEAASAKRKAMGHEPINVGTVTIVRDLEHTGVQATLDPFSAEPQKALAIVRKRVVECRSKSIEDRNVALKDACSNLRIIVERSIECHLCAKVVLRYRREITTMGRLLKLSAITADDCRLLDDLMTRYSAYEHSQPQETPVQLPTPDALIADLDLLSEWIKDFDGRAKAALTYGTAESPG